MTEPTFEVEEVIVTFDPEKRRSWQEGGSWPHAHHYNFYEAVVAAHYVMLGYHVLWDYCSTGPGPKRPVSQASSRLFQEVVGPEASAFFLGDLASGTKGNGQPDLFVFREDTSGDHKVEYPDPRLWFFVEVKGEDFIGDNQKMYWREVALRLGPDKIGLARAIPAGTEYKPECVRY